MVLAREYQFNERDEVRSCDTMFNPVALIERVNEVECIITDHLSFIVVNSRVSDVAISASKHTALGKGYYEFDGVPTEHARHSSNTIVDALKSMKVF